jgi:hypothetical protein
MIGPWLNDITTTPDEPPRFRALERETANLGRDMSYSGRFIEFQRKAYAWLAPLRSELAAQELFELVQATALESPGWSIASVEAPRFQLEAVVRPRLWPWSKDVVIQVRGEGNGVSSAHVRAKSRSGWESGAANAWLIRDFLARLERKLG